MPDFEVFSRKLVRLKDDPAVTLHRRGTLSLNQSALAILDGPEALELLFDAANQVLGLRPADVRDAHAYIIRRATPSSSGPFVVSCMAFVKHYGIDISVTRRRVAYLDDGILCVDMSMPGIIVTSNRAAR
ncbi:MAG: hypothetical protein PVSMB1_18610 [Gemmatimonadaceae bacterium]